MFILYIKVTPRPDHEDVAKTYHGFGQVYHSQGKHEMAVEHFQKCLAIQLVNMGPSKDNVGDTYSNIAAVYHDHKKHELALEYFQKCQNIGC